MNSIFKNKYLVIVLSLLVVFVSLYPVLNFYFWHDDFSTFYTARTGICIFSWPYQNYCPTLGVLTKFFGYQSLPYFILGIILAGLTSIAFYFFIRQISNSIIAFITTIIYSTFYVGAGVFQEAYDPIISFPSLGLLLLSLIFFCKSVSSGYKKFPFIIGLLFFVISVLSFSARSATNFVSAVALIFIFARGVHISKRFILAGIIFMGFFVSFFTTPSILLSPPIPTSVNIVTKTQQFFQTSGSWILTDELQVRFLSKVDSEVIDKFRIVIALALYIMFTYSLIINFRNGNELYKIQLFSLIWIISMYLPYGLRADFRLPTTHRYLIFVFPGVLMAWATLAKHKAWIPLSIVIFIFSLLQIHPFLTDHAKTGQKRKIFYSQLHQLLPTIPQNSTLFFVTTPAYTNIMGDFFRVGYSPSEAVLGTEYGVDYHNFRVITESDVLSRTGTQNLLSFYYDGNNLFNTTNKNYPYALPSKVQLKLRVRVNPLKIIINPDCRDCRYTTDEFLETLKYIETQQKIKEIASIVASTSGEESDATSMLDFDNTTYWIGNRQQWIKNNNILLKLSFSSPVDIEGVSLISNSNGHGPQNVEYDSDNYTIKINQTDGDDVPVVNEIEFIPSGFKNINNSLVQDILSDKGIEVRNEVEKTALIEYLSSKSKVCLTYETGNKDFFVVADNMTHVYSINIPALGMKIPNFDIRCLNDAVEVVEKSVFY